jgi:hypothetical protein
VGKQVVELLPRRTVFSYPRISKNPKKLKIDV